MLPYCFGLNTMALKWIFLPSYLSFMSDASTYQIPKSSSGSSITSALTSYGRSSGSFVSGAMEPSFISKMICALLFTALMDLLHSGILEFSSHLLKMTMSALLNCSTMVAFMFCEYTSYVSAFTNEITWTTVHPFGTLISNILSSFHIPLYSIMTCSGLYLS